MALEQHHLRVNGRRTRREIQQRIARAMTHDWQSLSIDEKLIGRSAAFLAGRELAEGVVQSRLAGSDLDDGACGDYKDWRRHVCSWAKKLNVIDERDVELTRHAREQPDPRLIAYREGFAERMRELGG